MTGRPHIAVDARLIADGGIGTYLRNVFPRVARQRPDWRFTVLGNREKVRSHRWTELPNVSTRAVLSPIYSVREQFELPARCPVDADVFWAPHYNIPLAIRTPFVVTIHDVCHLALPQITGGLARRLYARLMFAAVRSRAREVLLDSEFSRQEMRRLVGQGAGNVTVSHLAVEDAWFESASASADRPIAEPYFVYIGNMKRHKNIPMLIRAFRAVQERLPHRLVLIGRREGLRADPELDRASFYDDRIVFTGELKAEEVRRFVAHAAAFVTVSLYEGFGLPPLEAMAAGCPCVVSRAGSLPEICGDAALYCDPRDVASISSRLVEIASNDTLRQDLVSRGRAHAREFSWDRCASDAVGALERAAS